MKTIPKLGLAVGGGVLGLAILSACGPELTDATDMGGSVGHANGIADHDAAFKLAESHCEKFGKVAQVTSQDPFAITMTFHCVRLWSLPDGATPKP